jgi:hypothetical protein
MHSREGVLTYSSHTQTPKDKAPPGIQGTGGALSGVCRSLGDRRVRFCTSFSLPQPISYATEGKK